MSYKVNFWFKNLMSYRLTKPLDWDLNELQRQLSDCEFHPMAHKIKVNLVGQIP